MATLVPTSEEYTIVGNKWFAYATFTSANDADDWTPRLGTVDAAFVTNGANNVNVGLTYSGTTIIVEGAGALANFKILAIGT